MCSWFVFMFLSVAWTYLLAFDISFDLYLILHHADTHSIVLGQLVSFFRTTVSYIDIADSVWWDAWVSFLFKPLTVQKDCFYISVFDIFFWSQHQVVGTWQTNMNCMATISTVKHKNQLYFLSDFIFTSLHEISFSSNFFLAFFFYCMHALNSWRICPWACWSQFQS